jgi:hypothetical protein
MEPLDNLFCSTRIGEACTFSFICLVSYSPLISDLCLHEELDDIDLYQVCPANKILTISWSIASNLLLYLLKTRRCWRGAHGAPCLDPMVRNALKEMDANQSV